MYVEVIDEQSALALDSHSVAAGVRAVVIIEGHRCDEVAIHFVTKEVIGQLHARFFGDPTPTDCISLPIDEVDEGSYRHLGEVFVCPEVACEYVRDHGGDPLTETFLYIVHGLLHLMGYDDIEEQTAIRAAEERHLAHLKEAGILPRL